MEEIYKDIDGYAGFYKISNLGIEGNKLIVEFIKWYNTCQKEK